MNTETIDLVVIAAYFIGLMIFGVAVRRTRGFQDYSLARQSVPAGMVFASLCGAYLGPGYSLGIAGKAYSSGFLLLAGWFFFSIQTCLVGIWMAPRLRRFSGVYTLGGVMARAYGSVAERLTGLVSVGLCIGFAAVLAKAGGTILAGAVGISLPLAIAIITGVGVIYAWTGGLKSVIATEGIQFSIVLASASATLLFAVPKVHDWPSVDHNAISLTRSAWESTPLITLLGMAVLFFLGETLIPPYANRALAGASEGASKKGFIWAGLFSVIWFVMMATAGIITRSIAAPLGNADSALISLATAVLPHGMLGLFFVALAAIVMSTQESLLNAASVCMTRDLLPPSYRLTDRSQVLWARGATLCFGVLAVFLALHAPEIIDGLLICYSIWAPTVLPALVWALFDLPTSRWAGVGSILFGGAGSSAILLTGVGGGSPTVAILVGLVLSAIGALIGYAIDKIRRKL